MSNPASYKQRKEDFVSNLSGGPVSEINNVTAVALVRGFSLFAIFPFVSDLSCQNTACLHGGNDGRANDPGTGEGEGIYEKLTALHG